MSKGKNKILLMIGTPIIGAYDNEVLISTETFYMKNVSPKMNIAGLDIVLPNFQNFMEIREDLFEDLKDSLSLNEEMEKFKEGFTKLENSDEEDFLIAAASNFRNWGHEDFSPILPINKQEFKKEETKQLYFNMVIAWLIFWTRFSLENLEDPYLLKRVFELSKGDQNE